MTVARSKASGRKGTVPVPRTVHRVSSAPKEGALGVALDGAREDVAGLETVGAADRVHLVCEGDDDAEVAPAAAQGPVEVGRARRVGRHLWNTRCRVILAAPR